VERVVVLGGFAQHFQRRGATGGGLAAQAPADGVVLENFAIRRVVIDDERAQTVERRDLQRLFLREIERLFLESYGEPERRTLMGRAAHPDLAVHELHDLFADREAETGAAEAARGR
jgi:hypothetical protein